MASALLYALFPLAVFSATLSRPQVLSRPGSASLNQSVLDFYSNSSGTSLPTIVVTDTLTSPSNSSFLYSQFFQYDVSLRDANATPTCQGDKYGYDLIPTSCAKALARFSSSHDVKTWGQRGQGSFQVKLPFRVASSKYQWFPIAMESNHFLFCLARSSGAAAASVENSCGLLCVAMIARANARVL